MSLTSFSSFYRSAAPAALLVAAVINGWIAVAHPLANAPTANLDTGEAARAAQAWKQQAVKPEVVLIVSSLMVAPVMQAEANFLGKPVERMTHRRCLFLERLLAQATARPRVFCLAVGGEMMSDAYFLVKNVLRGDRPDAIVFGVAPRDVQDNLVPGLQSTETCRTTASLTDAAALIVSGNLTFEQAGDLMLSRLVPLEASIEI